jgi:hypothetical protein
MIGRIAKPVGSVSPAPSGRAMSRFVLTLSGSQLGRSLRNGTRDIASDWKHWSWGERIAAVLAALMLLFVPALVGGSL